MGDHTKIQWTDASWNPFRGCSRISPGCGGKVGEGGCYAEKVAARFSGPGLPYEGFAELHRKPNGQKVARWTGKVGIVAKALDQPTRWKKPRRIFVNSMSDAFHEGFSNEQIAAVFCQMAAAPQHQFQVLTKRAGRMRAWFEWMREQMRLVRVRHPNEPDAAAAAGVLIRAGIKVADMPNVLPAAWPLPNVLLGVSCENQVTADGRIPHLLATPAAVRFISAEPLLGDVDLTAYLEPIWLCPQCGVAQYDGGASARMCVSCRSVRPASAETRPGLSWVIVGGESGPGARACHLNWIRNIVHDCEEAKVPLHVKQLGARPLDWVDECLDVDAADDENSQLVKLKDRKGGDMDEWGSSYLKVRMFPGEAWAR